MTQRGGKGLGGEPKRKQQAATGQRTVSKIAGDREVTKTGKKGARRLKLPRISRSGSGHVTPATSASFDKSKSQPSKEPGRDSRHRKSSSGLVLIDVVRGMVRPYTVSLAKSLRSPKIRTTTSRTRTGFYVDDANSSGSVSDDVRFDDEISVAIYLDTDDQSKIDDVLSRAGDIRSFVGYDEEYDVIVQRGSIFHRAKAALKRGVSSKDVVDRITKIERAFEIAYLDNKQAEVDTAEATAVQLLLESIQSIDRVCMRVGSILLIKFQAAGETVLLVRNLSQMEIRALERYPEIQGKPEAVLSSLATAVEAMASLNAVNVVNAVTPGFNSNDSM